MGKGQKPNSQKISPWGSGGWEEPGRSPEQEEPGGNPEASQDGGPRRS